MAMQISISTSDPASATRAFPWPVLEAGNSSFKDSVYSVSLEHKEPGRSFSLTHEVEGAGLITNWINTGRVRFVCSVAAPVSAYRELHVSDVPIQMIEWDPDDLGSHPLFTPMIVSGSDIEHIIDSERDDVNPLWNGKTLRLSKGSRVAVCSTFALKSGVLGLLDFCLQEDYEPGVFKVEPSREEGFKFKVYLSPNLFVHLKYHRHETPGTNIMTHIVSAALTHLKNDFAEDDGEEGWRSYINLSALAELLELKGLGHWENDDFEPELVATSLYPHKVEMVDEDG